MSDIPVWSCEFFPLKDGTALEDLTVGSRFGWKCHGDIPVSWDETKAQLAMPKEDGAYTLAILQTLRQDPNDVQYEVTAYKAGEHKPEYLRVLQGKGTANEKGFEVAQPKWAVKSVLDPKNPQQQPYGPFGPWNLGIPFWFVLTAALLLVTLIFLIVRKTRKMNQRRRMLDDLKLHKTALSPIYQFYRDARQLRRRMHTVKETTDLKKISEDLDREFRLFVLRQFQVPALEWSNRAILDDIRRRHRKTYRASADPLKKTLRELQKLKAQEKVSAEDLEQMHRMSLDTAEKLVEPGGRT